MRTTVVLSMLVLALGAAASRAHSQNFAFAPAVSRQCTPQHGPTRVVATDVDQNGSMDLLIPGRDANKLINWVPLDAAGIPGVMQQFDAPGQTDAAVVADFNGDGLPDLAVAVRAYAGQLAVYLRDEGGLAAVPILLPLDREPRSLVAGDWDGDGHMDLASAQYGNQAVLILRNDGTRHFQVWQRLTVEPWSGASTGPQELLAGDMNGDRRTDLVVTNLGSHRIDVLFSNGDGTFAAPVAWRAPALANGSLPGVTTAALGDLDNDGDLDIAVSLLAGSGPQLLMVLVNDGSGHFGPPLTFAGPLSGYSWATALGDLDGDGDLDAVTGTALPGGLFVWENITQPEGAIAFAEPQQIGSGTFVRDICIANVDGDCDPDVAYAEIGNNTVRVYRQLRECSGAIARRGGPERRGGPVPEHGAYAETAEDASAVALAARKGEQLRSLGLSAQEIAVLLSTYGGPPDRAGAHASLDGPASCGPDGPGGRCDEPHLTPGCFTTPCCSEVCAVIPTCCEIAWDQLCVEVVESGVCNGMVCPMYGPCDQVHDDPGCEETACCARITRIDGYCSELWDHICVQRVAELCGTAPCTVQVPPNAIDEGEPCYQRVNDGPNYRDGAVLAASCGATYTGTITSGSPRDSDWFLVPADAPHQIEFSVTSEFPSQVILVNGPFEGPMQAVQVVHGGLCVPAVLHATLSGPGPWHLVVTLGTPAGAIFQGQPCTEEDPRNPWSQQHPRPTPGFDGTRYVASLQCQPVGNPADFNHDGRVDGADLGVLLGAWGATGVSVADLNGSGLVDGADLGILLGAWGPVS